MTHSLPQKSALSQKTALVTGASKGIGRAIAERLARDGAFVLVAYAGDKAGAEKTVHTIAEKGGKAAAVHGDVSTLTGIQKMFEAVDTEMKKQSLSALDILVNNAGIYMMGKLEDTTEDQFDRMFDVNVKGLFFTTQHAAKRMAKGGRVINISSAVARVGSHSMLAYAATKGAVNVMTRDMAIALGEKGITVNAVSPGLVRTEGTAHMTKDADMVKFFESAAVLGRIGEGQDIADTVAFLASDDSRWVTAQIIEASGGYHL